MQTAQDVSFATCDAALQRCGVALSAAEAHGFAVGLMSSACPEPEAAWAAELYVDLDPADGLAQECRTLLDGLYSAVVAQMADPEMGLQLGIPETGATVALRDWAQGFLYGVGLAGQELEASLSPEAREMLRDVYEIAQLDVYRAPEDEATAAAQVEIEEYLRVVAFSIQAECAQSG